MSFSIQKGVEHYFQRGQVTRTSGNQNRQLLHLRSQNILTNKMHSGEKNDGRQCLQPSLLYPRAPTRVLVGLTHTQEAKVGAQECSTLIQIWRECTAVSVRQHGATQPLLVTVAGTQTRGRQGYSVLTMQRTKSVHKTFKTVFGRGNVRSGVFTHCGRTR